MANTFEFPYRRIASVALVASAVGVASILVPIGEMDDFLKSYWLAAIVSVLLWLVLAKRLRGQPRWFAAMIGLLSPVIACVVLAPVGIGLVWALFLAKAWYFTLPIAVATGLAMHHVVNEGHRQAGI